MTSRSCDLLHRFCSNVSGICTDTMAFPGACDLLGNHPTFPVHVMQPVNLHPFHSVSECIKGVVECGKETNTCFFFGALPDPPSSYLPNMVCFFHIYVFSNVFWSQNIISNISNLHGPINTDSILSTALCGVRSAARACLVIRHELVIHTHDVKLHVY
jgi:hypothetical protein